MRRWIVFALGVISILLVDQISKQWILEHLALGETYPVIPALYPVFQFTYSANTGAAFGIFPELSQLFQILPMIIVLVILYFVYHSPNSATVMHLAFGLVVGGALGNFIDRLQHGHVVDFFHIYIPPLNFSNVSNFADHAIVFGVIILLIDNLLAERRAKNQQQIEDPAEEI